LKTSRILELDAMKSDVLGYPTLRTWNAAIVVLSPSPHAYPPVRKK
jgi:hypothetical protein